MPSVSVEWWAQRIIRSVMRGRGTGYKCWPPPVPSVTSCSQSLVSCAKKDKSLPCVVAAATARLVFSPFFARPAMARWARSSILGGNLDKLVSMGTLARYSDADEWRFLAPEAAPGPSVDFVVSFTSFLEHRFRVPTHPFFCGLRFYYRLELQHLNPNGIQHIAIFITLCEGFLGIDPNFDLWWYFFSTSLLKPKRADAPFSVGCVSIYLRSHRA